MRRLLDSAPSDEAVTVLWRTASGRSCVDEAFDADGRTWLEQVAQACRERLAEVDPVCTPYLPPARTDLAETVLREVREATRTEAVEVRGVVRVLEDVVTTVDPDLGFRLLLEILFAYDVPVTDAQRVRYQALAEQLRIQRGPPRRPAAPPTGVIRPATARLGELIVTARTAAREIGGCPLTVKSVVLVALNCHD